MIPDLNYPLIVISDVHLKRPDEKKAVLLAEVLAKVNPASTECLVLLGDIFDFCFGATDYYRTKFAFLGKYLEKLATEGVKILFFEGNHEFNLDELGWKGPVFVKKGDREISLKSGEIIKFAHGDLIKKDIFYRVFRAFIKSKLVKIWALCMPGGFFDRFALWYSSQSRKSDKTRKIDHQRILNFAQDWASATSCTHAVFGHFHTEYLLEKKDKKGFLVCLPGWEKPNILVYKDSKFSFYFLEDR